MGSSPWSMSFSPLLCCLTPLPCCLYLPWGLEEHILETRDKDVRRVGKRMLRETGVEPRSPSPPSQVRSTLNSGVDEEIHFLSTLTEGVISLVLENNKQLMKVFP